MGISPAVQSSLEDVIERSEDGLTVLSSSRVAPRRRLLYVNSYGGSYAWGLIKQRVYPSHHLWGCVELLHLGYEIGLAQPVGDFERRRPFPHDAAIIRHINVLVRSLWHSLLRPQRAFWTAFLKRIGLSKACLVALLYAREPLDFAAAYAGVIGLTPSATEHARMLAPKAKVAHLGWGVDLDFFPSLPYEAGWFLSCGKTHRDHSTLAAAASRCGLPVNLVCPGLSPDPSWPANVTLVMKDKTNSYMPEPELIRDYYPACTAALVILKADPDQKTAVGFTSLIEAMALARPAIVTRTGALRDEVDVEKEECGLFVPPGDPETLANAMRLLADDPARAEAMGKRGRRLCEEYYNASRFATDLHAFLETL